MLSFAEVPEPDRADTNPPKGDQVKANGGAGSAYYAVTALMDGEVEGGVGAGFLYPGDCWRGHFSVFEGWAGCEGF